MSASASRTVGRGRRYLPAWTRPIFAAGALGAVAVGGSFLAINARPPAPPPGQPQEMSFGVPPPLRTSAPAQNASAQGQAPSAPDAPRQDAQAQPSPAPPPPPPEPDRPPPGPPALVWAAPVVAPLPKARVGGTSGLAAGNDAALEAGAGLGAAGQGEIARRLASASALGTFTPEPSRDDPNFLLARNTDFDCLMSEPADTRMPGAVSCIVQGAGAWSKNGKVRIIPPMSRVDGTIEGPVGRGERRVWVNWIEATWPEPWSNVVIPLKAAATDPMGQSGMPGDYQSNVGDRIWEAAAGSLLDFVSGGATSALSALSAGTYFNFGQLGSRGASIAQMAYQRNQDIPASIVRGPASLVKVRILQPINTKKILALETTR